MKRPKRRYDAFKAFKNCYKFQKADEFDTDTIQEVVEFWDSHPTPNGHNPRLLTGDRTLLPYIMNQASTIVLGSSYQPNDPVLACQYSVDLGYKIFNLAIDCECHGIRVSITNNFDSVNATKLCKCQHSMEYTCDVAVVLGREDPKGGILQKLYSWLHSDDYRIPLTRFVIGLGNIKNEKITTALDEMRHAFSFGNAQTWRIVATEARIHFLAVSELPERFLNVGFAVAAFEIACEHIGLRGKWKFDQAFAENSDGYCVTFMLEK